MVHRAKLRDPDRDRLVRDTHDTGDGVGENDARTTGGSHIRLPALFVVLCLAAVSALVVVRLHGRHTSPGDVTGGGIAAHPPNADCAVSRLLVPSCGHWWGVAPLAHTGTPLLQAMREEERTAGRSLDIVHTYHVNGELFPTRAERKLALQPGHHRLLLINWKPSTHLTWRQVARGAIDRHIDALADHLKKTFRHRFFLAIWHEPENDVVERPGSGMTAEDYRAMYRHVVLRLRSDGVTWAVTVMDYMGFDQWARTDFFDRLWPGNDVVDWIGLDPYGTGARSGYAARTLGALVDRPEGDFPGYYTWAQRQHPNKPIMLAEWGVEADAGNPAGQARFFRDVARELGHYPAIKALVYFDMPSPPDGQRRTYLRAYPGTTTAYQKLVRAPGLVGPPVP